MTGVPFLDQPGAAEWQIAVGRVLKGADPVETLVSRTRDGIPVEPLYSAAEIPDGIAISRIGTGVGIVQRVDHPDPRVAGAMARTDAANGASGLTLVFAGAGTARSFGLPTDQPNALPAVLDGLGTTPIALRCEFPPGADEALIDRVLEAVSAHGPGDAGPIDLAADPIGDAARIGRPVSALDGASWASATAGAAQRWVRVLTSRSVAGPLLRADGRPHHEAGASEAQELAAMLSAGVSHLRALDRAGLGADRLAFTLAADADQILTIAKCRAIRRLWARVEDACGLQPAPIRLHAETAWRMLARKDAWTNLLRNTVACAGAILGGVDSITVLPFTSALGLPDVFARRLARNTPLVLLAEVRSRPGHRPGGRLRGHRGADGRSVPGSLAPVPSPRSGRRSRRRARVRRMAG